VRDRAVEVVQWPAEKRRLRRFRAWLATGRRRLIYVQHTLLAPRTLMLRGVEADDAALRPSTQLQVQQRNVRDPSCVATEAAAPGRGGRWATPGASGRPSRPTRPPMPVPRHFSVAS